jgi:hypothetical protein
MTLPNFLIPGAAKSGTTSLWRYLDAHPQICMGRHKEPDFFTAVEGVGAEPDGIRSRNSGRYTRGLAWYEDHFSACVHELRRGEASTTYLTQPDSPSLIRKHIPDVQLMFIFRHPADRLYSHYCWEHSRGWPIAPFNTFFEEQDLLYQMFHFISSYDRHLNRYLQHFSRDQITVLISEELHATPNLVLAQAFRFLDVEPFEILNEAVWHSNPSRLPRSLWISRLTRRLAKAVGNSHIPYRFRKLFAGSFTRVKKLNRRSDRYPPFPEKARAILATEFAETIQSVEDILGRPIPSWHKNVH